MRRLWLLGPVACTLITAVVTYFGMAAIDGSAAPQQPAPAASAPFKKPKCPPLGHKLKTGQIVVAIDDLQGNIFPLGQPFVVLNCTRGR